eukprot:TRINITY_DN4386_c1_g1_i1.p1 TRINITY_DN4386_c1_g1~~TRINITY_DN4386_c1_g1_i1.p1  ORF type:complete len:135 (-),score=6.64 TRINITY_DN4386_c1_g1_i1:75-479(-)
MPLIPGAIGREPGAWNDFILCIEMLFFAVLHLKSFPWREFRHGIPDSTTLKRIKDVLSVNDYVSDAYHNFMPTYQEYVVPKTGRRYRTRTWVVGNLGQGDMEMRDIHDDSPDEDEGVASESSEHEIGQQYLLAK